MKFITEDDLRDLYRKEPFTSYEIAPGTRITPGARQFLADRQINLPDEDSARIDRNQGKKEKKAARQESGKTLCCKRLAARVQSAEALFLAVAEDILNKDVLLAQKIIGLKKSFSDIRTVLENGKACERLACEDCTGIRGEYFDQDLGDCFEVTEFHIQLEKGREIISLHRIRCALRELQLDIQEAFEGFEENERCKEAAVKVNQIINTLSQLICYAAGGEKCQRKV